MRFNQFCRLEWILPGAIVNVPSARERCPLLNPEEI